MKTRATLLLDSFDERWKKYRAQWKACKNEFSEEAVHDLRVATRRLLAVLDLLRAVDPHPRIQKAQRILKNQLDEFDDLRDVQVMLVDTSKTIAAYPSLKPFEEDLQDREKKLLRKTRKQIKGSKTSDLAKRVEKIRVSVEKLAGARGFREGLLEAVDSTYLRAMQAHGQVDASQAATIHRLRIAFKKFRYTIEIVHPFLQEYPDSLLERMHDYQSKMGLIQDNEVLLATYADAVEQGDMEAILRYFEQRQAESLAAYLAATDEILVFWRAAANQPFPWEKNHVPLHRSSRNRGGGRNARLRRRQPANPDGQGPKKDEPDRAGVEGTRASDGPDPDQPLPPHDANGANPEAGVLPEEG